MAWDHASESAQASAEGQPTRRQVIAGLGVATIIPASLLAAEPDPLMEIIVEYRRQIAVFSSGPEMTSDESDRFAEKTFAPLWRRLRDDPPIPTTREGAIEALRMAHEEMAHSHGSFEVSLVAVALAYFEGEA